MGEKAVLLSFRIQDNEILNDGVNKYFDKVPTKFADWSEDEFRSAGFAQFRVRLPAVAALWRKMSC